jgi:hypothetical protein
LIAAGCCPSKVVAAYLRAVKMWAKRGRNEGQTRVE